MFHGSPRLHSGSKKKKREREMKWVDYIPRYFIGFSFSYVKTAYSLNN
jgi:hypothetical protein